MWKLKKTVYGLKDAARAWYDSATGVIEKLVGKEEQDRPGVILLERKR